MCLDDAATLESNTSVFRLDGEAVEYRIQKRPRNAETNVRGRFCDTWRCGFRVDVAPFGGEGMGVLVGWGRGRGGGVLSFVLVFGRVGGCGGFGVRRAGAGGGVKGGREEVG